MGVIQIFSAVFQRPGEFVATSAAVKDKFHFCFVLLVRQLAPHDTQITPESATGAAVEGIADGIQNRGLAGACFTADEKQSVLFQFPKINILLGHIRAETLKTQRYGFHPRSPSSRLQASTSWNSIFCASVRL